MSKKIFIYFSMLLIKSFIYKEVLKPWRLTTGGELLFLYTVKDANPNGDPLEKTTPVTMRIRSRPSFPMCASKRTVRDEWVREGKNVFVDGEP